MKTIIITGASRGIGLATAKKFLDEGWRVIGTYFNTDISLEHENLTTIRYDQGNSDSIAQAVEQIKKITDHIDVLFNNAAILIDAEDKTTNPVKLRDTLEVNVVGLVDFTEHLLQLFQKDDHIINMSSDYGIISSPVFDDTGSSGYRISKTALCMYTRHLAFRLQDKGIIVSALVPGWVNTDMGNSVSTETEKPDRQPEEVANDVFQLITTVKESGYLWKLGGKIEW